MKKQFCKVFLLLLVVIIMKTTFGQAGNKTLSGNGMNFELKNDTLYSDKGLRLFVGQQLIIGSAAGDGGQFRSIVSTKAAIVPSIWGQDKRYDYGIENYIDSKKNKEKLKQFLVSGNSLTIKGIGLSKEGKPHFYMVLLSSETGSCKADIQLALRLGELLIKQ